jgi:hypothetical protein
MKTGILRKKTFFHFFNFNGSIMTITLKRGTKIYANGGTITFIGLGLKVRKILSKFFIEIEGELYPMYFPEGTKKLPYPLILI